MRNLRKDKKNKTIWIIVAIIRDFKQILTINNNEFYNKSLRIWRFNNTSQLRRNTNYNRQIFKNNKIHSHKRQTDDRATDICTDKEVNSHRRNVKINSLWQRQTLCFEIMNRLNNKTQNRKIVYSVLFTDRQTDWTTESDTRTVSACVHQQEAERLS